MHPPERRALPNEAEFRSYYLLTHIRDSDVLRATELLPSHVFNAQALQAAIDGFALIQRSNMGRGRNAANSDVTSNCCTRLFKLVASRKMTFLQAAVVETHFRTIITGGIKALVRSQAKYGQKFPLSRLASLCALDLRQTLSIATALGLEANGSPDALPKMTVNCFRASVEGMSSKCGYRA